MNTLIDELLHQGRVWQARLPQHPRLSEPLSTACPVLDEALDEGGWPTGALTELLLSQTGIGELRLFAPAMRALNQRGEPVFWLNPPFLPYAPGMHWHGLNPALQVVVRAHRAKDVLWALEKILQHGRGMALAWPDKLATADLRRLQLAAERGRARGVLFRPLSAASLRSPAALRLQLSAQGASPPRHTLQILKRRGGWPIRLNEGIHPEIATNAEQKEKRPLPADLRRPRPKNSKRRARGAAPSREENINEVGDED